VLRYIAKLTLSLSGSLIAGREKAIFSPYVTLMSKGLTLNIGGLLTGLIEVIVISIVVTIVE
jgi:hypothetical protein